MTSKVNTKRAKLVKAKVKTAKAVKVVKNGRKPAKPTKIVYDSLKGTLNEVDVAKTEVNVFVYPNKGKYEIDEVKVNINGKDKVYAALTKTHMDINALKLNDLVKQLFIGLINANPSKFMFGYKNVYSFAFGLVPKGFNSYKAVIAHHIGDGQRSLILNANKHFGMGEIEKALAKLSLAYENHKSYVKLYMSKENIGKVTKACQGLVEINQGELAEAETVKL